MSAFSHLISFESPDGEQFFANLGNTSPNIPSQGSSLAAYRSFEDLQEGKDQVTAIFQNLLPPLPRNNLPIYCVGLNFKSHAEEASLNIPKYPPLWSKPAGALAAPEEDIPMSKGCASGFPDWEGELVFVTSKECRDVSPEEAESIILGYTAGNDLTCRFFQLRENSGGQFFYAKAFDKFAPIGPVLTSADDFAKGERIKLITRVNGQVVQNADLKEDMISSPAKILSFMSQGTTIPAFTAVMTGTPKGVGYFRKPKQPLNHEDIVEVEITNIGVLKNRILFPEGK